MKQTICPLYAPADAEAVRPVLDALRKKGVPVRKTDKPKRGDAVLLFLSENLKEDSPAAAQFFAIQSKTASLIPVALDESTPPELIKNALLARNTIAAERYSADELAERIASAVAKKNRLPWIIGIAGAAVLIAAAVLLIVNAIKAKPAVTQTEPQETPAPTAVPRVPERVGLRPEDLARVHQVFIIGDRFYALFGDEEWVAALHIARVDAENYVHRISGGDGAHWLDNDTGDEIALCRWDDLDFLRYMINLQFLDLVCMEGTLPDLSGLSRLDSVRIFDSRLSDLAGLAGTRIINLDYTGEAMDFSPLNNCERLRYINMDLTGDAPQDLDSFGPPSLTNLTLSAGSENGVREASGLLACNKLTEVRFEDLRLPDLSCLANARSLAKLDLNNLPALTSLNGLAEHKELKEVYIDNCFALSDLNALIACPGLRHFNAEDFRTSDVFFLSGASSLNSLYLRSADSIRSLHGLENHTALNEIDCEGLHNLTDISALSGCTALNRVKFSESFDLKDVTPIVSLPRLKTLELYGAGPDHVNYLADIVNKDYFSFGVSEVADWSGLTAITRYDFLNVTDRNGSALPYIKDAKVNRFELWFRGNNSRGSDAPLDYSLFPDVQSELRLHGIPTLVGLPAFDVTQVTISESDFLTSLDGIQNLNRIKNSKAVNLEIRDCPRLSDWSALEGLSLSSLRLEQLFTLPSFKDLSVSTIRLESIVDLQDLSPLSNLDPKGYYNIELFDIDGVTDLSPLNHLKGYRLSVPAHLSQHANLLKESGNFSEINIEYPNEWWHPYEPYVKLLSLDELDTLPSALLAHVQDLNIYGDRVINWDMQETDTDWNVYPPVFYVTDRETGEREEIPVGTMTDLSRLSKLTGLKNLNIQNQALESLEGIQYLGNLEDLCVEACFDLTDASAAFTMQNLKKLQLTNAPITSIEGVQNLTKLEELKIWSTQVDSIEGVQGLSKLRFFDLQWTDVTDFTPISALPDDCEVLFAIDRTPVEDFLALPDSVLAKVREIRIVGDTVYNPDSWWYDDDWSSNGTAGYLSRNGSNERFRVTQGPLTDLSFLSRLLNLRRLDIFCNPIESLDGIEVLTNLEKVEIRTCPKITDVSVLFDMPSLYLINVNGLGITSIEGIEKLPHLQNLTLSGTQVTDLSPLAALDLTEPLQDWSGFDLSVDNLEDRLDPAQYHVLSVFPEFWCLNVFNTDCALWMDAVKNVKIREIHAGNCRFTNETFKAFIEQHPELEYIKVSWTRELTDISPLLTLKNLDAACISHDMPQARESLGDDFPFRLDIEY
ncbi:MAG: hypothetical protein IKZ44_05335 [Clostridia bacterium]|nr:hypothetical protein [Clostridia bacterium]